MSARNLPHAWSELVYPGEANVKVQHRVMRGDGTTRLLLDIYSSATFRSLFWTAPQQGRPTRWKTFNFKIEQIASSKLASPKQSQLSQRLVSMRLTEHENKRDDKELVAVIVTDMQDPVTPVLNAALGGEGLHEASRAIARLSEVVDVSAPVI
jgi:hypothetical protein